MFVNQRLFFIDKLINVLITKKPRSQPNQYTGCSLWATKALYKKQGQGHILGKHGLSIKDFYYFLFIRTENNMFLKKIFFFLFLLCLLVL